jgi:hypothetical protein
MRLLAGGSLRLPTDIPQIPLAAETVDLNGWKIAAAVVEAHESSSAPFVARSCRTALLP